MRIAVASGFGPGHLIPLMAISAELVRRGHTVDFHAESAAEPLARAAGCRFTALPQDDLYERVLALTSTREAIDLFQALAERAEPHFSALLAQRRIELALVDVLHVGAALAAQGAGIPWASVATSPALLAPHVGDIAQAKVKTAAMRRRLGLPKTDADSLQQAISPRLHLLSWTREFDLSPAGAAVHAGPLMLAARKEHAPAWLGRLDPAVPTVMVGVSTTPFRMLRGAVNHYVSQSIRALNELPVQGIITLADEEYTVSVAPAPHVRVERFVPHGLLMPRLTALVTHGGWGTMGRALGAGVPMVVVPFALDQPMNARMCEDQGLGFCLPCETLDAEDLYARLRELLRPNAPERTRALAQQRRWANLTPASSAADRILALA